MDTRLKRYSILVGLLIVTHLFLIGQEIESVDGEPLVFGLFAPVEVLPYDIDEFTDITISSVLLYGEELTVRRSRRVDLNPVIFTADGIGHGDSLVVPLFNDVLYTGIIDRVTSNINGTVTIRARVKDHPMGYMLISTTSEQSLGSITIPGSDELYFIEYGETGDVHYLLEIEHHDILEGGPSQFFPDYEDAGSAGLQKYRGEIMSDPMDHVTVDVMIVYTPAAKNWAGGSSGIANVIGQAMGRAQLSLDNSDVFLSLDLVHSAEVDYVESGDERTDLRRLTTSPDNKPWGDSYSGYMDEVHEWRDRYAADLVALFSIMNTYGGLAWQLNNPSGFPEAGFSMTRVQQAANSYTYIHETGHNMGAHHHKQDSSPGPGLFSYSAGWKWEAGRNRKYASVMSYPTGGYTNVPYFSNPDVEHEGVPTGHSADGDNARTLRETKHVVASYRGEPVEVTYTVMLEVSPGEAGTLEIIEGEKDHYYFGDEITITASASGGYQFDRWLVNSQEAGNATVLELTVEGNTTVTGIFKTDEIVTTASIALQSGWNLVSSNVIPDQSDVEMLFSDIVDKLIVMKAGDGKVYWPSQGVNGIKDWQYRSGYQVYMNNDAELSFTGTEVIPSESPIELSGGWNMVAYFSETTLDPAVALESIGDDLMVAKDNLGGVYWPEFNTNTLGNMSPGQGYQLYLHNSSTLVYPAPAGVAGDVIESQRGVVDEVPAPERFVVSFKPTGVNATMVLKSTSLVDGDEVGVFTSDGVLVGSGVVRSGNVPLTVWGRDDMGTGGAKQGDVLSLRAYLKEDGRESLLQIERITDAVNGKLLERDLLYSHNGIYVVEVSGVKEEQVPALYVLSQNYPNPFNPSTTITFSLPENGYTTLKVYNTLGIEITTLVNEHLPAGNYSRTWDASGVASGLYLYQLRSGNYVATRRMLLLK